MSIDYTKKVLVLGEPGVGKKTLLGNYANQIFDSSERLTIGVEWFTKRIKMDDKVIVLQFWLVGREERFRFLLPSYVLGAVGAIIIYDITRPSTLDNISEWMKIITTKGWPIPVVLVGNKIELEKFRAVPRESGIQVAEKNNMAGFV